MSSVGESGRRDQRLYCYRCDSSVPQRCLRCPRCPRCGCIAFYRAWRAQPYGGDRDGELALRDALGGAAVIARRKPIARHSKPRSRRKGKRASLARQADQLWSVIVRRGGKCEGCGGREHLQAAHGFSRRYRGTRWLPINGFCLCRGCHKRFTHDQLGWTAWLKERWGLPVYEELERRARAITKSDHAAIVTELTAELERPA